VTRILFQLRQARDKDREQIIAHAASNKGHLPDFTFKSSSIETNRAMRQTTGGQLQNALSHLIFLYSYEDDEIVLRFNAIYKLFVLAADYNKEFDNTSFSLKYLIVEAEHMAIYPALNTTKAVKKNTFVKMLALRHSLCKMHDTLLEHKVECEDDQHLFECRYFSAPFEIAMPIMTLALSKQLLFSMEKYQFTEYGTTDSYTDRMALIIYIRQMSQLCSYIMPDVPSNWQRMLKLQQMLLNNPDRQNDSKVLQFINLVVFINRMRAGLSKMDALKMDAIFPDHAVGGGM
jgi:hypothetical protein